MGRRVKEKLNLIILIKVKNGYLKCHVLIGLANLYIINEHFFRDQCEVIFLS